MKYMVWINHPYRAQLRFGGGECIAVVGTDKPTVFDDINDAQAAANRVSPTNNATVEEFPYEPVAYTPKGAVVAVEPDANPTGSQPTTELPGLRDTRVAELPGDGEPTVVRTSSDDGGDGDRAAGAGVERVVEAPK